MPLQKKNKRKPVMQYMNNRIVRTKDGRAYDCAECHYRNRETGFCGFCMMKIVDDMTLEKLRKEAPANALQSIALTG